MHGVFKLRDLSFKVLLYSIPVCVCVRIRVRSLEFVCVRLATTQWILSTIFMAKPFGGCKLTNRLDCNLAMQIDQRVAAA